MDFTFILITLPHPSLKLSKDKLMICCASSFQNTVQHRTWLRALVRSSQSTVDLYHDPVCKVATRKSQVSVAFAPPFFTTSSCSSKSPMLGGMVCCASPFQNRVRISWWFREVVWLSGFNLGKWDDFAACRISASCSTQKGATAMYHVLSARDSVSAASKTQRPSTTYHVRVAVLAGGRQMCI